MQHDFELVAALETVALDQAFRQIRVVRVEPVIDVLMNDKRAAIRHVDIATVPDNPVVDTGSDKNLRQQLPTIRCPFEHDAESARKRRELTERQGIEFIDPKCIASADGKLLRERVEGREVVKARWIGQIAEDGRRARRRRLRRMRLVGFASLTTSPTATPTARLPASATTVAVATTFTLTLLPSITSASPTILPLSTPAAALLLTGASRRWRRLCASRSRKMSISCTLTAKS